MNEAIKKAFKNNGLDRENFNHDITAFNHDATKCMIVYDNGEMCEKLFILVGLIIVDGEWKEVYFKDNKHNLGCYDGIDAMCYASCWLDEIN